MYSNNHKIIFWLPRVICLLFILFVSLFALDVFDIKAPWYMLLGAFFLHLIPSFVMLAVLLLSFKYNLATGIIFILLGALYMLRVFSSAEIPWYIALSWSLTIAGPAIIVGGMLVAEYFFRKKT